MNHYQELEIAARVNLHYHRTKHPNVAGVLKESLYELLEAMVGKKKEKWTEVDLPALEISANMIASLFGVRRTQFITDPVSKRIAPPIWHLD